MLVEKDLIRDNQLNQLIANEFNVSYVNLQQEKIDEAVLNLVPELVAKRKGVIAFARDKEGIKVGMTNPGDLEMVHLLQKQFGDKVIPYYTGQKDIVESLVLYKSSLQEEFSKIISEINDKKKAKEDHDDLFIKLVDLLLQYGYQNKASDIHIEPYARKTLVRFRIDGIMHDVLEIPKNLSDFIIARIKIMAKMRTDEHRSAQDGKLVFKSGDDKIDVRVSIVPVTQGENLVLRVLADKNRRFSLNDLGINDKDLVKINQAIRNPHGMILVTGPTGSGKTTTLYAILKILNKREVHIATIEDPVEYDIEGVSQIQVDTKTNLTFAKGLRAIVRQDPDIIMVGEIRDEETAGIAINSALTGHLVLSTLHTNDAPTTIPRLLDMGIEPFLAASTVNVVIAQRLVRVICEKCRSAYAISEEEKNIIKSDPNLLKYFKDRGHNNLDKILFYKGNGCKVCSNTGFSGRLGVFEILEMTDKIREQIVKNSSSGEIMKIARSQGMTTMLEDGIEKVFNGITTFSEVFRVTRE
ncbi:MAG: Type II secretion system protein E [Parcubacteria group bacterium ADurb.Bin316]|nr:MAG: Type II secretion system protein E [Parcubacteria group bacterium ADurb.Bin316]